MFRRGATVVEYVAVIGAIVLVTLGALLLFGKSLREVAICGGQRLGLVGSSAACGGAAAPLLAGATSGQELTAGAADGMHCGPLGCSGGVGNCFVAGTPVETEHGPVAIETVRPGDSVVSVDPATGETSLRHVIATKRTLDRPLVELTIAFEGKRETIQVTPEHPFYVRERGFVPASTLEPGAALVSPNGTPVVESMRSRGARATVFNFEVEDLHTYVVGASRTLVHNDCNVTAEWTRRVLGLPNPFDVGVGEGQLDRVQPVRSGESPNMGDALPLPETPRSIDPAQRAAIEALRRLATDAYGPMRDAARVQREYDNPRVAEAMRNAPRGSSGFVVPHDDRSRALSDATAAARARYHDAIARLFAATDLARAGGDIRYDDQGRVISVTYPNAGGYSVTYEGVNVRSITFRAGDGATTRVYTTGEDRGRIWRLDVGRGASDPQALYGRYVIGNDGTVTRTEGARQTTITPTGDVRTNFTRPEVHRLESDVSGGLRITVTQSDNGVALSVMSRSTGMVSNILPIQFTGDVRPRIVRTEGNVVLLSLDGSDSVHVAVAATTTRFGEGVSRANRLIPYYDEANLRVVMRAPPDDTNVQHLRVVTAGGEATHHWIVPPSDPNFILEPRWRAGFSGSFEGQPRAGWRRGNQFVADTTAIDRRWAHFLETYGATAIRAAPVVGPVVMAGEAITGTELTGRAMGTRERFIHGGLALLGGALEFGPAVYESVQAARTVSSIQRTLGVTRAEATALMRAASELSEADRAVLSAMAAGRTVEAAAANRVAVQLEQALARVRVGTGANANAAAGQLLARAERTAGTRVPLFVRQTGCFVAGTEVLVAASESTSILRRKHVEDVEVGDVVVAWDPDRAVVTTAPVAHVMRRHVESTRMLVVEDAHGHEERIHTTDEHPVLVPGRGWVPVRELADGDPLLGSKGEKLAVARTEIAEEAWVYNLSVSGVHDYFVAAGPDEPAVLVHNSGICSLDEIFAGVSSAADIRAASQLAREIGHAPEEIAARALQAARELPGGLVAHGAAVGREMRAIDLSREYGAALSRPPPVVARGVDLTADITGRQLTGAEATAEMARANRLHEILNNARTAAGDAYRAGRLRIDTDGVGVHRGSGGLPHLQLPGRGSPGITTRGNTHHAPNRTLDDVLRDFPAGTRDALRDAGWLIP